MRCSSCQSEFPAGGRFCGNCGAPRGGGDFASRSKCGRCGFANLPDQTFCGGCGEHRRQSAPAGPELKIVTVLFSDVSGFTSLSESLEPEELRDLMDGWFERLGKIVRGRGGTIDKFIGDAVMALFGAPIAREDDPRRAIDAALDMHEALTSYNREIVDRISKPLAIRVGINTGRVYAGMIGAGADRAYTVMGDAVNVASRLESECPVGSVLISQGTYQHVRGLYESRALEPLAVKGKREPLNAYEITGRRRASVLAPGEASESAAVAGVRRRELAAVRERFEATEAERRPALVLLAAEPGIGKGAFLRRATAELAGRPLGAVLRARCEEELGAAPLQVLADFLGGAAEGTPGGPDDTPARRLERYLRRVLGAAGESDLGEIEESIRLLSRAAGLAEAPLGPPSAAGDPRSLQQATFSAAEQWLRALARRDPVIGWVENLHLAPAATRGFLAHLLAAEDLPLFVLATVRADTEREGWEALGGTSSLELLPLEAEEARQAAGQLLSRLGEVSATLVNQVAERSGGNPGFMEEIVRVLAEEGTAREGRPLPVPQTIGQMLQARVDRLGRQAKRVLQWAAAAGATFDAAALVPLSRAEQAGMDAAEIEDALGEARAASLVVEAESASASGLSRYRFRPALAREIVYEATIARQRRAWHRTLADARLEEAGGDPAALEASVLDEVAHHLERAGDDLRAGDLHRRAGDAARAVNANRDACVHYRRASELLERAGAEAAERAAVLEALGEVESLDGDYASAIDALDEALSLAEQPVVRSRLLVGRGRSLAAGGEQERARASYQEAMEVLEGAEAKSADYKRAKASALQHLGWSRRADGHLDWAESLFQEGLEVCKDVEAPLERARLEDGLGDVAMLRGDLEAARAARERALELREEAGHRSGLAASLINLGGVHFVGGAYKAAASAWRRALALHEEAGNAEGIGVALLNLGAAELELEEIEGASEHLERAVRLARRTGAWYLPECLRYLAESALAAGEAEQARRLAEEGLGRVKDAGLVRFRGSLQAALARAAAALGRRRRAEELFESALFALEASGDTFELAVALFHRAALAEGGETSRSRTDLERARELLRGAGNLTWLARVEVALSALAGSEAPSL